MAEAEQGPRTQVSKGGAGRRGSIAVKLLVVALVCLIANGVFVSFYFPSRYEADAMATLRSKMGSLGEVVSASLVPALDFDDLEGTLVPLGGLRQVPEVIFARVLGDLGGPIAYYVRGEAPKTGRGAPPVPTDAMRDNTFTQPITAPGGRHLGRLEIYYSTDLVHAEAVRFRNTILLVTLLLVLANGLAITVVSRRMVQPLMRLTEAARKMSSGEFDHRLDPATDDEVGELTESFGTMTARLIESRRLVEMYTDGLEALVAKRTEELSRKNQELFLQTQRAEEANRLKSEFLANMSHELRTPLSSIIGFLTLILEGISTEEEEQKELLNDAHHSSLHLLSLINYLLDLAKIEAGRLDVSRERVDVGHEFAEVQNLLDVQARARMLTLRFESAPGTPDALADAERVRQVLINLVGNAIKFTPKGSITVRSSYEAEMSSVMVEVVDTGIGVPKEKLGLLFGKFTQVDGSRTRKYGGTGLGLALSKSLVELMGGRIGLESAGEGKGTRVWFTLPVSEAPGAAPGPGGDVEDPTKPLVLVVEDDAAFGRFLGRVLRGGGFRVLSARTADEARRIAEESRPFAMTVDLALPAQAGATLASGVDLIEMVSARLPDMRILVISGEPEAIKEYESHAGLKHDAYPVLPKPVDPAQILRHLGVVSRRSRSETPTILVADDAAALGRIVERVIRGSNSRLMTARNGVEALQAINAAKPPVDLLLLDLDMPELDGFGVLRALAKIDPARRPEVLVVTNYPELAKGPEGTLLKAGYIWGVIPKTRLGEDPELLRRALARLSRKEEGEYAATHPSG
jgi:signal transduction histidine kinase/CheY-like chemotaxis protein